MRRDDFSFTHTLRVRWAEVDRQGIVFNANYFLYFDVAIAEYWRAIGFDYPDGIVEAFGSDIFAVKASADYHGSAGYDDVLEIGCRVGRIGRSSMQFLFGVFHEAEQLASGEIIYVNAELASKKPTPWPDELKRRVLAFERTPPALPTS